MSKEKLLDISGKHNSFSYIIAYTKKSVIYTSIVLVYMHKV